MQVVVARVGKPHGLRGEVTVQVHTDVPEQRFVPGALFSTDPAGVGPLTLTGTRVHNGVRLLSFADVADRTAAERLRGVTLFHQAVDGTEAESRPAKARDGADRFDPLEEGWYEDQLVGLRAVTAGGDPVGEVVGLHARTAQHLLVLRLPDDREALVPFVHALVPEVDLEAGRVVLDLPPGLLDLDDAE